VIHVAGTNGKGSVCAFARAMLEAQGLRVHVHTSPHLVNWHERYRLAAPGGGRLVEDDVLEEVEQVNQGREITFFEITAAAMFLAFSRYPADAVVLEVGLGGTYDATNVVPNPAMTVIQPVGMDHKEFLGNDLAGIAAEKAGIIKPMGTLVLGVRRAEPREVILETARRMNARVLVLGRHGRYAARGVGPGGTELWLRTPSFAGATRTPLLGVHQARNAALAALTAEVALEGRTAEAIGAAVAGGIPSTRWPARAEIVGDDPPVLVDVAHNVEGARALAETVRALFPKRKAAFVAAFSRDKAHEEILAVLARVASRFTLTQFEGERATPATTLAEVAPARHLTCEAVSDPAAAMRSAISWARRERGVVVVTGSFYLMPEAMAALGREVPRAI